MDGWVVFSTKLDTKDFDKQIAEVEYELEQVEYELSKKKELKLDDRTISEYESKAEKLRNKIIDLKKRQEDLNNTRLSDVNKSIDKIGDSVSRVIKKIGKWALAVFSIRSAYSLISRSVSTLSQYNDQIKADIQYISYSLASALQPVIEYLINLVFTLLKAINSLSVAWFGVNLFANATADSMNKSVKSAEKLKKSLAGFDEMNVLQDTSSSGGGAGSVSPSVDLSKIDPQGVEKTKNFWKDIAKFWEEDVIELIDTLEGNWAMMLEGILFMGQGFYYIFKGIIDIIIGLFKIVVGIFTGNLDLMKEGWNQLLNGFINVLSGAIQVISGIFMTLLGIVKGIFLDLFQGLKGTVNSIIGLFKNIGTKVGDVIGGAFKTVVNAVLKAIENILNNPIRTINALVKTINKVPGINLTTLPTFKLPRLAVGGIVNMPGRGVPIGGAITGERGAEGVIPLTDSQAMETLGATIGRYITINANITNTMNGRVISRELQKINTNNNFATNR